MGWVCQPLPHPLASTGACPMQDSVCPFPRKPTPPFDCSELWGQPHPEPSTPWLGSQGSGSLALLASTSAKASPLPGSGA